MGKRMDHNADVVLQFIKDFFCQNGYVPTIREICDGTHHSSTGYIWTILQILMERGDITPHGKTYSVKGAKITFDRRRKK